MFPIHSITIPMFEYQYTAPGMHGFMNSECDGACSFRVVCISDYLFCGGYMHLEGMAECA